MGRTSGGGGGGGLGGGGGGAVDSLSDEQLSMELDASERSAKLRKGGEGTGTLDRRQQLRKEMNRRVSQSPARRRKLVNLNRRRQGLPALP